MGIENHEQVFFLGDLNFRINAFSREQVLQRIEAGAFDQLLAEDDLFLAFNRFEALRKLPAENRFQDLFFRHFQEGKICFKPTYKYDIRSNVYDTSRKQRVPAYCDRILWKRNSNLGQLFYNSIDAVDFTDHKPVVAYFLLETEARTSSMAQKCALIDNYEIINHLKVHHNEDRKNGKGHDLENSLDFDHFCSALELDKDSIKVDNDSSDGDQDRSGNRKTVTILGGNKYHRLPEEEQKEHFEKTKRKAETEFHKKKR